MTEKDNHNEEEELRADEMADQQTSDNVADNASAEDGEGEIPVENAEEKDPLDIALSKIEEVRLTSLIPSGRRPRKPAGLRAWT